MGGCLKVLGGCSLSQKKYLYWTCKITSLFATFILLNENNWRRTVPPCSHGWRHVFQTYFYFCQSDWSVEFLLLALKILDWNQNTWIPFWRADPLQLNWPFNIVAKSINNIIYWFVTNIMAPLWHLLWCYDKHYSASVTCIIALVDIIRERRLTENWERSTSVTW